MTRTTFNLARMNMLLHGVHYRNFDIKHEDTLEHPQHIDMRFEAIVANPPFSAKWSANPLHLSDDRFSQYGKLAPSSKADFAFVQHMLYQLDDSGTMAVILPHGALFRGAAEGHIRKYLIEDRNWLDAVIGLPANIFYGTSISTCILIFKKCRENPEDILFIDASNHFEKAKNQNILRRKDIDKIVATYRSRKVEDKYSHIAPISEVVANEYNINIPRYVDTFEEEELVNIEQTANNLIEMQKSFNEIDNELNPLCLELNIPSPVGCNLHLLQTYKRGLMQKIFSQEVRFKADDGSAFPNWNEKYLGDISEVLRGGGLSKSSLSENGKFKCLLYGELFRKHGAVIVNVDNRTNVNEGLSSRSGDILMPTSDVTPYGLATASVIMLDDVRLGGDINVVRLREGYDCMFISYLLNYMKKEIIRLVTGTTIKHIYARDIKGLALNIPKDVLEQRRISRIFSLLDKKKDLIDSENSTIEPANKSLQQKTFI
jgi:type I restriction enzyme M protein